MAPSGVIAHWRGRRALQLIRAECSSNGSSRSHRALEATPQPSSIFPFVILLRLATPALKLGLIGSLRPSVWLRTQVQPAIEFVSGKEGLRPRFPVFVSGFAVVCSMALRVHVFVEYVDKVLTEVHDFIGYPMLVQVFIEFAFWDTLKFACAPGLSGGRGEMAMAVASSARLAFFVVRSAPVVCRSPDAFPFWSLYSDGPLSSRPQPLGSGGDVAPCEDTRRTLTVRLISVHHVLLQGGFYFLCRWDPLA